MSSAFARGRYDAIVVGVGGVGSAATAHLAQRGQSVLGLERFDIPHARGSSHGHRRVVSRSFYDLDQYMPLYDRSIELWHDLEAETGERIFHQQGSLTSGRPGTAVIETAIRTCQRFDVPHQHLDPATAEERFPGYCFPSSHNVVYQPNDGFLAPERGVVGHVRRAHVAGAEIHARTRATGWEPTVDGVVVHTDAGAAEADASGPTMRLQTCLYTNTPGQRFVLDTHPELPQIVIAASFSGHGYKFCPVISEILAELVCQGSTNYDLTPFGLDRFA